MILWTLRHTRPHNPDNLCYGRADFDVAPSFETEYPPVLESFKDCRATRLFCSPLKRCTRLAEKVSSRLALPIETKEAIIEVNFGEWELQKLTEVPRNEMAAWKGNLRGFRFPGGESFHDVDQRVIGFLESCLPMGEILWVTHAGVIAALQHSLCGVPDEDFVEGRFPYAMLTRFEFSRSPEGRLSGRFDTIYGGLTQPPLVMQKK